MNSFLALIVITMLLVGVLFLSSARLGIKSPHEYEKYNMRSEKHMRTWGWVLLTAGIFLCGGAGVILAVT